MPYGHRAVRRNLPALAGPCLAESAATLLQEPWQGHRVVGLEGAQRVTPNEIAAAFAKILGRAVQLQTVPRDSWEELFRSQGMKNPLPRIRMLDGFNEGWITFEKGEAGTRKGSTTLESVLKELLAGKP